jgi:hypothetical protein
VVLFMVFATTCSEHRSFTFFEAITSFFITLYPCQFLYFTSIYFRNRPPRVLQVCSQKSLNKGLESKSCLNNVAALILLLMMFHCCRELIFAHNRHDHTIFLTIYTFHLVQVGGLKGSVMLDHVCTWQEVDFVLDRFETFCMCPDEFVYPNIICAL